MFASALLLPVPASAECDPVVQFACVETDELALDPEEGAVVFPDPPDTPARVVPVDIGGRWVPGQAGTRYRIESSPAPWASSRNRAGQFFVNSVRDGTLMTVVKHHDPPQHVMGYIEQEPGWFCGWVMAQNVDPMQQYGWSECPSSWDMPPSHFSRYINCETCNGGWAVTLKEPATLYRNAYPWVVPAMPNHASVTRPAGYTVYWRYVSEDGNWVAVSDPQVEHLKWFFVRKSALPGICGDGANAGPPTSPDLQDWGPVCKSKAEGG